MLKCFLVRRLLALLILVVLLISQAELRAADTLLSHRATFNHKHQAGIRLGMWSNLGDTHPEGGSYGTSSYRTSISDGSFYFEGFGAFRVLRPLMAEVSFGMVNRGSVTINEGSSTDIGNLMVYPIMVGLKFYPLAGMSATLQPFLSVTGGVYYGRRNVQITTAWYYYSEFAEESATKLGYSISGGVDWPISSVIGLELSTRYMPIEFSKDLVSVSDYSAFTVAVGIKYLFSSVKNGNRSKSHHGGVRR